MTAWWSEFLSSDVSESDFTDDQKALFDHYQLTLDQKRIFQCVKTGKNLFLSDLISDEEVIWNIGVIGVNDSHRGDFKFYRTSVIERLQRFDQAEQQYQWHSGKWTKEAMRVLIGQWTLGMMVVVPGIESLDNGSPMIFTKEWYEHMPLREDLPDGFWEFRAATVYPLMTRSICRAYPMATMKGLVSLADMTDFDWDKYDMEQKMRHSNIQAVIPNKLRRMISVNPDEKMKKQLEDYKAISKKYGFVMYDSLDEAIQGETNVLPLLDKIPTWVGGLLRVDIKQCLQYLFHKEPETLTLMEEVYTEMEQNGDILCPSFMEKP